MREGGTNQTTQLEDGRMMVEYTPELGWDEYTSSSDSSKDEGGWTNGMAVYRRGVREGQRAARRRMRWPRDDGDDGGPGASEEERFFEREFTRVSTMLERVKVGEKGEVSSDVMGNF